MTVAAIGAGAAVLAGVAVGTVGLDVDQADPAEDPVAADASKGVASPTKVKDQTYSPATPCECRGCFISCVFCLCAITKVWFVCIVEHGLCGSQRVEIRA